MLLRVAKCHQIQYPAGRCILPPECGNTSSDTPTYLLCDPVVHSLSHLIDKSDKILVIPSWLVQVKRSFQNLAQPLGA
jgi:hypothetical protein